MGSEQSRPANQVGAVDSKRASALLVLSRIGVEDNIVSPSSGVEEKLGTRAGPPCMSQGGGGC